MPHQVLPKPDQMLSHEWQIDAALVTRPATGPFPHPQVGRTGNEPHHGRTPTEPSRGVPRPAPARETVPAPTRARRGRGSVEYRWWPYRWAVWRRPERRSSPRDRRGRAPPPIGVGEGRSRRAWHGRDPCPAHETGLRSGECGDNGRSHRRQHRDLLLGWEEHVEPTASVDLERGVEPSERVRPVWRHLVQSRHVAREPRQCERIRCQNLDPVPCQRQLGATGRAVTPNHRRAGRARSASRQLATTRTACQHPPVPIVLYAMQGQRPTSARWQVPPSRQRAFSPDPTS